MASVHTGMVHNIVFTFLHSFSSASVTEKNVSVIILPNNSGVKQKTTSNNNGFQKNSGLPTNTSLLKPLCDGPRGRVFRTHTNRNPTARHGGAGTYMADLDRYDC